MGTHPIFESDFDCLTDIRMRFLCFGPRMSWRISNSLVKTRSTGGEVIFGDWSKTTEVHYAVKQSQVDHFKASLIAPSKRASISWAGALSVGSGGVGFNKFLAEVWNVMPFLILFLSGLAIILKEWNEEMEFKSVFRSLGFGLVFSALYFRYCKLTSSFRQILSAEHRAMPVIRQIKVNSAGSLLLGLERNFYQSWSPFLGVICQVGISPSRQKNSLLWYKIDSEDLKNFRVIKDLSFEDSIYTEPYLWMDSRVRFNALNQMNIATQTLTLKDKEACTQSEKGFRWLDRGNFLRGLLGMQTITVTSPQVVAARHMDSVWKYFDRRLECMNLNYIYLHDTQSGTYLRMHLATPNVSGSQLKALKETHPILLDLARELLYGHKAYLNDPKAAWAVWDLYFPAMGKASLRFRKCFHGTTGRLAAGIEGSGELRKPFKKT